MSPFLWKSPPVCLIPFSSPVSPSLNTAVNVWIQPQGFPWNFPLKIFQPTLKSFTKSLDCEVCGPLWWARPCFLSFNSHPSLNWFSHSSKSPCLIWPLFMTKITVFPSLPSSQDSWDTLSQPPPQCPAIVCFFLSHQIMYFEGKNLILQIFVAPVFFPVSSTQQTLNVCPVNKQISWWWQFSLCHCNTTLWEFAVSHHVSAGSESHVWIVSLALDWTH